MKDRIYIANECYVSFESKAILVNEKDGISIALLPEEYKILIYFITHVDKPVSLEDLAEHLWGINYSADAKYPESIKPVISRLRKKLRQLCVQLNNCIATNHGYGTYTCTLSNTTLSNHITPTGNISKDTGTGNYYMQNCITSEKHMIPPSVLFVGSNIRKCNFYINSESVSLVHACIYFNTNKQLVVKDMNSVNGTYINGLRLPLGEEKVLSTNDTISFANEAFQICYSDE